MGGDTTEIGIGAAVDAAHLPAGNVKVTREDWLRAAMDLLVSDGVGEVKVLTLGARLGVSRSSFYWYFRSRDDLLAQLLAAWERTNTGVLLRHAERETETIAGAVCNVFLCFIAPGGFDYRLDFAVREWARRDASVRHVIDRSDAARQAALTAMYERFGYPPGEADVRARVLYYQQIGYHTLDIAEDVEARLALVPGYLLCFTGAEPDPGDVARFEAQVRAALAEAAT